MVRLAFLILNLLIATAPHAAELLFYPDTDSISINGPIEKGDADNLKKVFEYVEKNSTPGTPGFRMVLLNSPGGDVEEALSMGRTLRNYEATATIPQDGICYSSCVFLLAGAVNRMLLTGEVGIHRPFFISAPDDVDKGVRMLQKISRDYFEEMNIPSVLADDMFSTPPSEIKVLTSQELEKYRLNREDMIYLEKQELEISKRLGLSRLEYLERSRRAKVLESQCWENSQQKVDTEYLECFSKAYKSLGLLR
ncbi:ATP-dependent Clp protease proteolytic subunit [Pseudomonas aeruginosa]|uniref:ATP-dependent Clp protease proteolytic subunit n=1 Tax=Pseudomonas aeruginosa TaxID=287 RepID=UPI002738D9A5|nr:ATP-dependent Clp protease proteolytic subunit [Pseudomonas aeruginosa]